MLIPCIQLLSEMGWVGASRKGETPPKGHIPLPQSHLWALG